MTFYINKANALEHTLSQSQQSLAKSVGPRESHEDSKVSRSMKGRQSTSPFLAQAQGPMEQLQPLVQSHSRSQFEERSKIPEQSSGPSGKRAELGVSRSKRTTVPMEESSKLNVLIEEYRRENDRCSKRISELQRKLNATANRR